MKLKEIEVDGSIIYMKKDSLGWRLVHPIKKPDGTYNWINFLVGGKRNFVVLIIILIMFGLLFLGFNEVVSSCRLIAKNPCEFCSLQSNIFSLPTT